MAVKITCGVDECAWSFLGAEADGMRALGRHEVRQHPMVAEADYILAHPDSVERRPREAREPGCACPVDLMDSWSCPIHSFDRVW